MSVEQEYNDKVKNCEEFILSRKELYHVTLSENIDSIKKDGLLPKKGCITSTAKSQYCNIGVYLETYPYNTSMYCKWQYYDKYPEINAEHENEILQLQKKHMKKYNVNLNQLYVTPYIYDDFNKARRELIIKHNDEIFAKCTMVKVDPECACSDSKIDLINVCDTIYFSKDKINAKCLLYDNLNNIKSYINSVTK